MNSYRWLALALGCAVTVALCPARAQDAASVLQRVDSVLTAPSDMTATQRMTLIDAEGREKVRTLRIYQKGLDRRLAKFLTPADVRDVGFLRYADDRMYLYLPAFRRVRRIASSIKHQEFMGTDLSYEDLSRTRFGDDYRVVEAEPTDHGHRLVLEPRPQADVSYGRILMEVTEDTWVISALDLFDAGGDLMKTIRAYDITQVDGYWLALRVVVETVRDGHRTVLEMADIQMDTGLSDEFFSQRQLKLGG